MGILDSSNGNRSASKDGIAIACCLLWPFIFLLPYVMPWSRHYAVVGNDFKQLYFDYKFYWLAAAARGVIPHWSPSEACGFPFLDNPFAAAFYPLNYLLLPAYAILHGYSMLDHQRFTVAGISIFTAGLYAWLRFALRFERRACLMSALMIGVSGRMTELLRFPNAVHAAAWYPWILLCLHNTLLGSTKRRALTNALGLAIATACLLTAGYPYFTFYALFLVPPYALLLLVKPLRDRVFVGAASTSWDRIMLAAIAPLAALSITLPYLLDMKMLLNQTSDRAGGDWSYATAHVFSLRDTFGSFVFPLAANFEGIFYFSAAGVLLIICFILRGDRLQARWTEGILILWIAFISSISHGASSAVFRFLWSAMPGFDSLRAWGRASVILLPLLAWLLARAYAYWEENVLRPNSPGARRRFARNAAIGLAVVVLVQWRFVFNHSIDDYWMRYFFPNFSKHVWKTSETNVVRGYQLFFLTMPWTAALALTAPAWLGRLTSWPRGISFHRLCMTIILGTAALDLWATGPWLWCGGTHPTGDRRTLDYGQMLQKSFSFPRLDDVAGLTLSPEFSTGLMPSWYFQRYRAFLRRASREPQAGRALLGIDPKGQRVFMTDGLRHKRLASFIADAGAFPWSGRVLLYTGDELTLDLECRRSGFLSFIDNWDPNWQALIDGRPAKIELLFGTFKSILVPAGRHRVTFQYTWT